jgi:hypothetical protein
MSLRLRIGNLKIDSAFNWASYWATRYISSLSVVTTSDTEQTITATIVGTGYDGVSYEYSTDGINYTEHSMATGGTYNAAGLTAGTLYYWRARLYKGIYYGNYSIVGNNDTLIWCNYLTTPNATKNQITGDIDIIIDFSILSMANEQIWRLGKWENNHESWNNDSWLFQCMRIEGDYYFSCCFTTDGVPVSENTWNNMVSKPITTENFNLRIRRIASTGVITYWFFGAGDGTSATRVSGNLYDSTRSVQIGEYENTSSIKVRYLKVYAGDKDDEGILKISYDAQDYDPEYSTTKILSASTGEEWTIVKNESGYNANSLVVGKLFFIRDIIMTDIYLNSGVESTMKFYQFMNLDVSRNLLFTVNINGAFSSNTEDLVITPSILDIGSIPCEVTLTEDATITQSRIIQLKVANSSSSQSKKILCIGDSFTDMGKFQYDLLTYLPDSIFLGIRTTSLNNLQGLGYGGWNLNWFSTLLHPGLDKMHSPLLQPIDPYKYYGETAFWKNTWDNPTDYNVYGFSIYRDIKGFVEETGYLSSPNVNDVVYDTNLALYKVWNGNSWETITLESLEFTVNFTKFLSTWGVDIPDFVIIMLLTNDANYEEGYDFLMKEGYDLYKTQLNTLITSITSLGISVFYMIPCVCNDESVYGVGRDRRAECLIYFARNVINDFSSYPNVHIIDAGSELILITDYSDSVHPNDTGMVKISKKLASAIRIYS